MTAAKFGLTLSNRSVVLGLSDVDTLLALGATADRAPVWDSVWLAIGDPARCAEEIAGFVDAGVTTVTLRLVGHDEKTQFERVTHEVLPGLVA